MRAWPFASLIFLTACISYPQLDLPDGAIADRSDRPRLLPFAEILAIDVAPPQIDRALIQTLEARVARLRARAAAMRRSALTTAERTRIRQAVARLGQL